MSFKDIDIKACYESGTDNIIEDFYYPVLSNAIIYDRIAGFFSSTSLAIAASGLCEFIKHNGRMRIIASPILNPYDSQIIEKLYNNPDSLNLEDLCFDIEHIEDTFVKNHVKALGWMLQQGYLEIKLAVLLDCNGKPCDKETVSDSGIFHQKVGVLQDREGNAISFSGSINETAMAWCNNDEEFKVFKSWSDSQDFFLSDKARFEQMWNDKRSNLKMYDLPSAIKNEIISYSKDFDLDSISLTKFKQHNKDLKNMISLFPYQQKALESWIANNFNQLFEMATGTGKTRTAIACIKYLFDHNDSLLVIITTPQNTLSKQWMKEVDNLHLEYDEAFIADGTNFRWKSDLPALLGKMQFGIASKVIIFTTHNTASSNDFVKMISNVSSDFKKLFVGDEVHWLGAKQFRKALLPNYQYRIGLSATPSRWFDDSGTRMLVEYFGNKNFVFSMSSALHTLNPMTGRHFLVDYKYHIDTVGLDEDETAEYAMLTEKISKLYPMVDTDPDAEEIYNRLLEKRANIIKNARQKYGTLEKILDKISSDGTIKNLLIFVSPQQKQEVMEILNRHNIIFQKLTEEEGTKPQKEFGYISEREYIINCFKSGFYQAIVAIKCLDEGIDIPTADTGILMSSSTNPREYVQRIGRIIRQEKNKVFANLYDICVDSVSCLSGENALLEQKIKAKEIVRLKEVASNAINAADAMEVILKLK